MSNQIFLICNDDNHLIRVEARFEDENVWLTQRQIVDLFQTAKSTVSTVSVLKLQPNSAFGQPI